MTHDQKKTDYEARRDAAAEKYANKYYVIAPDSYHERLCSGYKAGFDDSTRYWLTESDVVKGLVEVLDGRNKVQHHEFEEWSKSALAKFNEEVKRVKG